MKKVDTNLLKSVITQNEYQNRLKEEEEMWNRYGDKSSKNSKRHRKRSASNGSPLEKKSKDQKIISEKINHDNSTVTNRWNNDKYEELYPEDLHGKKIVNTSSKKSSFNYDLEQLSISHILGDDKIHQLVKYLKSKGHKKI